MGIVETFKNKRAPPEGIRINGQKFKFIGCMDEELDDQKFVVLRMKLEKKNAIACKTKTQIVVALADEEKNSKGTQGNLNSLITASLSGWLVKATKRHPA